MAVLWVILILASTDLQLARGLPVNPTPRTYPHEGSVVELWSGGAVVPALAVLLTAIGVLFGCTWCYRHKDCKPNGADNQLFTASVTHLQDTRRSQPPDSGFSEPVNNNISEDNNNGPISLREMQNIANNNATVYITSENEERNRVSRESVVEFEPLPSDIRVIDPLERCADWFAGEDFPRDQLQYLREIGRGWFGRVVEGEIDDGGSTSTVAVKILNQNASLEDKARFLDEARLYRDMNHENVLGFVAKCLQEDPWILLFELCSMDLQQYLIVNRPKMAILNESGVPLQLMCDVTSALAYIHSRGYLYGNLWSGNILIRGNDNVRAVLGQYCIHQLPDHCSPPESEREPADYTWHSEVWWLGCVVWQVCSWGAALPAPPAPAPPLPCPYRNHLYQVMQLCWNQNPESRPSAAQVHALLNHLHFTHSHANDSSKDDGYSSSDFEERWQKLKPNTIPKIDEHIAIVHAPSTSMVSHFTGSDQEFDNAPTIPDSLSVDLDTAVSRSSSIMSDRDPLSIQIKSDSLTNLHGSLEDVRNIYLTHNETATLECHQGNIHLEDREREQDRSDSSMDPWIKDIINGSQDDVSYYKDVSDVIKNLDNILNSEKTSSSESSHQASPSRDNLSLECKKDYPMQTSMVKSPGISNFQNIIDMGFDSTLETSKGEEEEGDDTIGTLSHSFERHSDTISQQTLENLTPETPAKDLTLSITNISEIEQIHDNKQIKMDSFVNNIASNSSVPKLIELCVATMPSVSNEVILKQDCLTPNNEPTNEQNTVDVNTAFINNEIEIITNELQIANEINSIDKEFKYLYENDEILPDVNGLDLNPEDEDLQEFSNDFSTKIHENGIVSLKEPINDAILKEVSENISIKAKEDTDCLEKTQFLDLISTEQPETVQNSNKNSEYNVAVHDKSEKIPEMSSDYKNRKNTSYLKSSENDVIIHTVINESEINPEISSADIEISKTTSDLKSSENNVIIHDAMSGPEISSDDVDISKETSDLKSPENDVILIDAINDSEQNPERSSNDYGNRKTISDLNSSEYDVTVHNRSEKYNEMSLNNIENSKTTSDLKSSENDVVVVEAFKDSEKNIEISSHEVEISKTTSDLKSSENDVEVVEAFKDSEKNIEISSHEVEISKTTSDLKSSENDVVVVEAFKDSEKNIEISSHEVEISKTTSDLKSSENDVVVVEAFNDSEKNIEISSHEVEISKTTSDLKSSENDVVVVEAFKDSEKNIEISSHEVEISKITSDLKSSENDVVVVEAFNDSEKNIEISSHEVEISKTTSDLKSSENDVVIVEAFNDSEKNIEISSHEVEISKTTSDLKSLENDVVVVEAFNDSEKNIEISSHEVEISKTTSDLKSSEYDVKVSDAIDDSKKNPEISSDDVENNKTADLESTENNVSVDDSEENLETSANDVENKSADLESSETVAIETDQTKIIDKLKISPETQYSDNFVYIDLINDTSSEILKDESLDINVKNIIKSCLELPGPEADWSIGNNSTVYLDLPSLVKETHDFLHSEKIFSSKVFSNICTSTPKGSDASTEGHFDADDEKITETKPDYGSGVTLTKLEQRYVPENLSPFDSPSKSHHTDTYDENSSVVLGPFENCTLDLFKGLKSTSDLTDLHKEEILALSSNFSEMNLETPSPLRDSNFLNEVPDIIQDEFHFDIAISEGKPESLTNNTDETEEQSSTEKHISPLTPPNSPGNFLASTSQKYLVDINMPNDSNQVVDLNHIELQMTTKLAMAENENNLNLEYSGPLSEEGLFNEVLDNDKIPESYLAGNKGSVDNLRDSLAIDEERMKELRNELELKLPLAQVAGIEPTVEGEWSELPPPPELVLTYGALSPIAEETRMQLCAYENDDQWNASTHTDSSASYPEPCNISDEVTDLPTAQPSTYTIHKDNHTYTLHKEVPSSKEITMSADSLNASPLKKLEEIESPIDDKTYVKEDEDKDMNCERLSQVSPFLLSPTTDTSVPESENIAGVSTLSKTTVPTDAKTSKPSESQCLSKATSIDSWCSNDTLYNVEENFDDLAMDSDIPLDVAGEIENDKSESDDTLTHNDEKELSHCSTYIIHDSKSEMCETFTPDSITANDNYTYTKVKSEVGGATPSVITKSDLDSKNTQTKDLAYGTLMSGIPTYSHCTTELASGIEEWKFQQPELVRRSPICDENKFTPPKNVGNQKPENENFSPQLNSEPCFKKMDSVEITCLNDNSTDATKCDSSASLNENENEKSPNINFRNMAPSVTSTPFTVIIEDTGLAESIPIKLPETEAENSDRVNSLPNFQTFFQSAEIRPQDISNVSKEVSSEILLEGESKLSNKDITDKTPGYSDFEISAITKPQDSVEPGENSSQKNEGSQDDFQQFESSVKNRPQDLSSVIDASSLLLKSERRSSELAMGSTTDYDSSQSKQTSEFESHNSNTSNFESQTLPHIPNSRLDVFITDLDIEEETEQPHSIIVTESPLLMSKMSPNRTFDSHATRKDNNLSYDSHVGLYQPSKNIWINESFEPNERVNGLIEYRSANEPISDIQFSSISMYSEPSVKESHEEKERSNQETNSKDSIKCNGGNEMYATVNFLNETFEELLESNVDDNELNDQTLSCEKSNEKVTDSESRSNHETHTNEGTDLSVQNNESNGIDSGEDKKIVIETNSFLQNEKNFCQLDSYFPLLSDIRFTGPATEIMSTSFTQDSPTDPTSPECEQDSKPDPTAEILKEWDSDSDTHSTNSSSGEFIWKDGDGHETALIPSTVFDHQRDSASQSQPSEGPAGAAGSGSGDSASGSEGDEVEFVPSSWDCRAAPAKSALRSLEQPPDIKKRVVFKRQKYHCVYEYPREVTEGDSPASYLPDYSTYTDWDPSSVEEAELGYGQLFGGSDPLDLFPLRSGIAFGADYDEDFFISSSARPFQSLGVMSTTSQFFPGMQVKTMLERELSEELGEDFPPPPSPLPLVHPPAPTCSPPSTTPPAPPSLALTRAPSFDFTPDSGVEDITPGSMADEDFKSKKLPEAETGSWRGADSTSSSESASPGSPAEVLGGLRHTRDKLKLDLPPSPHAPSPRHSRVFSFVLDKRRAPAGEETPEDPPRPLDTPRDPRDDVMPEPTFSTFGKSASCKLELEKIILTDELQEDAACEETKQEGATAGTEGKGEGMVLDSGDEDSGIESSSKATLERNKHTPDVS